MGLIPEEIISQIIDRCDIVEVINSYTPLKRAGRNFKANCPFHNEKTPSFVVNPDKQIFHCFGCGVGGNVVSFVMKYDRLEFPEAVRILAQKANVVIPEDTNDKNRDSTNARQLIFKINELAVEYFHKNLLCSKAKEVQDARNYLQRRGISLNTVKFFKLGFALDNWDGLLSFFRERKISTNLMEKAGLIVAKENRDGYYDRFRNRLIFPIFDTRNHCRAFGARVLEKTDKAKYINSPETLVYTKGHHLYGFNLSKEAILKKDMVVVVEGYIDYIIPYQAGVDNIVASLGTALTTEQVRLLRRYTKNVVMLFDTDDAGKAAMLRSLDLFIEEGMDVKIADLAPGEDPDSFVRKYGLDAFNERLSKARTLFEYKLGSVMEKHDVRTIEGKSKIAAEMLLMINKFESAVMKSGYLRLLSRMIVTPEHVLISELNKLSRSSSARRDKVIAKKKDFGEESPRVVERHMLKLLLEEDKYIGITKDEIPESDFQDTKIRSVISKIYEIYDKQKKIDVGKLVNSFEDQSLQNMISSLMTSDEAVFGDKERVHRDCIERMKKDSLKKLRHELLLQMSEAESSGDNEMLEKLKNEFNQISKK